MKHIIALAAIAALTLTSAVAAMAYDTGDPVYATLSYEDQNITMSACDVMLARRVADEPTPVLSSVSENHNTSPRTLFAVDASPQPVLFMSGPFEVGWRAI